MGKGENVKHLLFLGLSCVFSLAVVSCDSEERPAGPPPPKQEEKLPPLEASPLTETRVWIPKDYEMIGRWERPCFKITGETGKAGRDEIFFDDTTLVLTKHRYSNETCAQDGQISADSVSLLFEEGWEPSVPSVNGVFSKGWRGTFREKKQDGTFADYETAAHLVEEGGKKAWYVKWSTAKPIRLERDTDRYFWVGAR